jgi:[ribosomal protein S5]-alanine N-acetyltransferase
LPGILLTMADEAGGHDQAAGGGQRVRFVELSSAAMSALLDGSLARASQEAGVALTPTL